MLQYKSLCSLLPVTQLSHYTFPTLALPVWFIPDTFKFIASVTCFENSKHFYLLCHNTRDIGHGHAHTKINTISPAHASTHTQHNTKHKRAPFDILLLILFFTVQIWMESIRHFNCNVQCENVSWRAVWGKNIHYSLQISLFCILASRHPLVHLASFLIPQVPYETLCYVVGAVNYGGRVTDYMDQVRCILHLCTHSWFNACSGAHDYSIQCWISTFNLCRNKTNLNMCLTIVHTQIEKCRKHWHNVIKKSN